MVGTVLPRLESWKPPEPAVTWCQPRGASGGLVSVPGSLMRHSFRVYGMSTTTKGQPGGDWAL